MELYSFIGPVIGRDGVIFDEMKVLSNEHDWSDYNMNFINYDKLNPYPFHKISNTVIYEFSTTKNYIWTKRPTLSFTNRKKDTFSLNAEGVKYLDLDITFRDLKVTYRPKHHIDRNYDMAGVYDVMRMKTLEELDIFRGAKITELTMYNDYMQDTPPTLTSQAITIKGEIDFSQLSSFAYNHIEHFSCNIYPDRMQKMIYEKKYNQNFDSSVCLTID